MSYKGKLEALLFVAGDEGMTLADLSSLLQISETKIQEVLDELDRKYVIDDDSGLMLHHAANRYKLVTKKVYADLLREYSRRPMNQTLSRALLETLSIIAYKQPVTRSEVDTIRGVGSSAAISKLMAFELIQEEGKKEVIGRPILYATTEIFLDFMGINSLEELPDIVDLEVEDQELPLFETPVEQKVAKADEN